MKINNVEHNVDKPNIIINNLPGYKVCKYTSILNKCEYYFILF